MTSYHFKRCCMFADAHSWTIQRTRRLKCNSVHASCNTGGAGLDGGSAAGRGAVSGGQPVEAQGRTRSARSTAPEIKSGPETLDSNGRQPPSAAASAKPSAKKVSRPFLLYRPLLPFRIICSRLMNYHSLIPADSLTRSVRAEMRIACD